MALTIKQEKFCMVYIETGNASEAYRRSYNAENMKAESINVNACKMLTDAKIAQRLDELKRKHAKKYPIGFADRVLNIYSKIMKRFERCQKLVQVTGTMGL